MQINPRKCFHDSRQFCRSVDPLLPEISQISIKIKALMNSYFHIKQFQRNDVEVRAPINHYTPKKVMYVTDYFFLSIYF